MKKHLWLKATLGFLLLIGLIATTTYYYFSPRSLTPFAERIEKAISGPELIAIAYFDTEKMQRILNFIEGTPDPSSLPDAKTTPLASSKLLDASLFLNQDLQFVMGSIHRSQDQNVQSLYISAQESIDPFLNTFKTHFALTPVPEYPNWFSVKAIASAKTADIPPCPDVPQNTEAQKQSDKKSEPSSIQYLYVSKKMILLSSDLLYANKLLTQISNKVVTTPHSTWTEYRNQKLAAFMVINPKATSDSAPGMEGYLAKKYLDKNNSIDSIAGSLDIRLLEKTMMLDLSLFSKNTNYKNHTVASIQKFQNESKTDSAKFSKTLSDFVASIQVQNLSDRMSLQFAVDSSFPQKIRSMIEEALTSAFQPLNMPMSDQNPSEEKIQDKPIDYKTNQAFQNFLKGSIKDDSNLGAHFMEGPFLASAYEMKLNQKQELQLVVQGKMAVPQELIENMNDRQITASLAIDSVNSNNQKSVLVDERCVDKNTMMGSSLNHEAETFISSFQNETISINKSLRLLANTKLEDIQEIKGKLSIKAPTVVQSYPLALKVEEAIEQKNFRFFISKLTPDSVTYTISGEREKLLEVRAYNKDGKVLRAAGKFEINQSGKITQSYHGKIQKLEIFVAQEFVEHSKAFVITGPLKGKIENKELLKTRPPQPISKKSWDQTKGLNASTLKTDPNDWSIFSGSKSPRASQSLGNIQLYLTHTPEGWDNQPRLHIYHPFIPELSEVMSGLMLNLEAKLAAVPAETKKLQQIHLLKYSYSIPSGEPVIQHRVLNQAYLLQNVLLNLDLKDGQKLESLQGSLKFHLPTKIKSQVLTLDQLWKSVEVSGMKITLEKIDLNFMKGSHIRIEGNLEKLVNLYVKDSRGQLWKSDQTFIQRDGSVTLTLPLVEGVAEYELFLADEGYLVEVPVGMKVKYE